MLLDVSPDELSHLRARQNLKAARTQQQPCQPQDSLLVANGSDIQQILDLDDHLLKQFAMLIQFLRWSHLRARRRLLAADGSERVAKLLRSEDALAGLLHGNRVLLGIVRLRLLADLALLGLHLLQRRLGRQLVPEGRTPRDFLCSFANNMLTYFSESFELQAVQRIANLLDLEEC